MLEGKNVIVLDLETARSAEDCKHCGKSQDGHHEDGTCLDGSHAKVFDPIGWNNRPALGLSIGGYYDYADDRVHWFDDHTLKATMKHLVDRQPLMVGFNSIQFDFTLMRGLLRRRVEDDDSHPSSLAGITLTKLCDDFKRLAADSYDLLAEIWRADEDGKYERGLNSLDAIAKANGLGGKLSNGAQAPRDWAAGRYADVLNYCQDDILKTRALFEIVCNASNQEEPDFATIQRSSGPLKIAAPTVWGHGTIEWNRREWV